MSRSSSDGLCEGRYARARESVRDFVRDERGLRPGLASVLLYGEYAGLCALAVGGLVGGFVLFDKGYRLAGTIGLFAGMVSFNLSSHLMDRDDDKDTACPYGFFADKYLDPRKWLGEKSPEPKN